MPLPARQAIIMLESPVRTLRQARGLTIEQMAEQSKLSPGYLSRVERGERELGNASRRRVAAALQCDEDDVRSRNPELSPGSTDDLNDSLTNPNKDDAMRPTERPRLRRATMDPHALKLLALLLEMAPASLIARMALQLEDDRKKAPPKQGPRSGQRT